MNTNHNIMTWFELGDVLDYYNTQFQTRTAGKFKVPKRVFNKWIKDYTNNPTPAILSKDIIDQIAQVAINSITNTITSKTILPKIPFHWLMPDTQEALRQAVCSFIQNAILNDEFWERLNASNMSTPSFTMTNDTTNWLLQSDQLDVATKNWVDKSGIADYQVIQNAQHYVKNDAGNIFIVGKIDDKVMKDLQI